MNTESASGSASLRVRRAPRNSTDNPGSVIEVGGHTNGIPSHEFCDQLSTERAKAVAQFLVDKGLPASRLTYKGYGKRKPVASNNTPDGRARNQRVEIKIVRLE